MILQSSIIDAATHYMNNLSPSSVVLYVKASGDVEYIENIIRHLKAFFFDLQFNKDRTPHDAERAVAVRSRLLGKLKTIDEEIKYFGLDLEVVEF